MYSVITPGSISWERGNVGTWERGNVGKWERGNSGISYPHLSAALGVQWCGKLQILVG